MYIFSRVSLEKWRYEYENLLDDLIKKDKVKEALEGVYYISNLAVFLLKAEGFYFVFFCFKFIIK